jgi:endonuclease/exonuclease/phosphatase family metal-dependent hydrolase
MMPGTKKNHFQVVRATAQSPWWKTSFTEKVDLSDHHPCEWSIDELKGITYNIQFLPFDSLGPIGKDEAKDIKANAKRIAEFLCREHADYDVICLQELFNSTATQVIEEELKKQGYVSTKRVGGRVLASTNGGVRIFYKQALIGRDFETSHVYKHTVDTIKRGDAMVDKGIKHIKVQKNGKTYHVFNTHLQAFYEDSNHQHYVEVTLAQLTELRQHILSLKKARIILEEDQVVICGDLNIPKDAKGATLENTDALFKRAQLILGQEFQLVEQSTQLEDGEPSCSFDPSNNTYLSGVLGLPPEPMHANLDLVFTFDKTNQSAHPTLDRTVRYIQKRLSHYIQENIHFLTFNGLYQFSDEDRTLIAATSKALDALIVEMTSTDKVSSDPFDKPGLQALLDFSKALPIMNQLMIESALTAAFLERCGYKAFTIETVLKLCRKGATQIENMDDLRLGLKELRQVAMNHGSLEVEQAGLFFSRIQHAKPVFTRELEKIEEECAALRTAGEVGAAYMGELLCMNLKQAFNQYLFSLKPEKESLDLFKNTCIQALTAAKPALSVHIGMRKAMAEFFIRIGEELNLDCFQRLGRYILSPETKAVQLLGHFKQRMDSSTLLTSSYSPR